LAIVLGSGFYGALRRLDREVVIPYAGLPGFPQPRVAGHPGHLVAGWLGPVPLLVLHGRAHYYEGSSLEEVTFPIRVLAALGVKAVLLTSAAGAIDPRLRPGDFMAITDHLNFMGAHPLRGWSSPEPTPFVDLAGAYDPELVGLLGRAARVAKVRLRRGVYLAVSGPTYETPAEIRAFGRWGAQAVGMSTVPEAIVARQCRLRVAALSLITNLAAGRGQTVLTHREVLAAARASAAAAERLLTAFVEGHAHLKCGTDYDA
jgi:inosine/guanosine/xanthosine phosphorylase family protein